MRALWTPAFFQTCAMHPGHVSGTSVIAAKSRRCAVPSGRVQPAQKGRAVFHLFLLFASFEGKVRNDLTRWMAGTVALNR